MRECVRRAKMEKRKQETGKGKQENGERDQSQTNGKWETVKEGGKAGKKICSNVKFSQLSE